VHPGNRIKSIFGSGSEIRSQTMKLRVVTVLGGVRLYHSETDVDP